MRAFVNRLRERARDERGLTLIELIASLTLLSVVMGIIYSSITFGMSAYNKIRIENSLRDEGDLIMSSIISKLYTYGPDSIAQSKSDAYRQRITLKLAGMESEEIVFDYSDESAKNALFFKRKNDDGVVTNSDEVELDSELVVQSDADWQEGSYIRLVCSDTSKSSCSSGLIEIQLKLRQMYANENHDLVLESKFGF
ncbi:prepilin-type N-terminal cleavage/methylation domain-containing protein [Paenibacillus xanthanilyticus]|uniref:Prepilin-type N-terminal cleavage/methylation domain-containing protein n=1 Tax=Paenibacillus xanthanilyticus TaxID=1783531 RepID=A0ABV8KBU3_9BACL